MKIAIDASRVNISQKTGTEYYSSEIIKNLLLVDSGKKNQYILYSSKPIPEQLSELSRVNFVNEPSTFQQGLMRRGKNLLNILSFSQQSIRYSEKVRGEIISLPRFWTQIGLAWKMLKDKPDILFIPSHTIPWLHPRKTVVVIHGLEYEYFPNAYSFFELFHLRLTTKLALKWAKKIIVPSRTTKNDLIKFYQANPNQIKVIYHGIHRTETISQQPTANQYFLFIGRLEKRKNLISLIKSFEILKKYKPQVAKYKLILVGKKGFGFKEIQKAIVNSPYKNDIILKDYVSEKEKKGLLKNADVFIFVSFCEGFGFPVLEAMEAGIPVVASNNSCLSEISGSAALLVNPQNVKEISEAVYRIIKNDSLRKSLIEKGRENIKRFDWQKCAKETLEILESL